MRIDEDKKEFDHAAERMIELGNLLLDEDHDTDSWEVASGLLAGAVHFWLKVNPSQAKKCKRCWHRRADVGCNIEHPEICGRCVGNVEGPGEKRVYA